MTKQVQSLDDGLLAMIYVAYACILLTLKILMRFLDLNFF